jgi:hypothetical protein
MYKHSPKNFKKILKNFFYIFMAFVFIFFAHSASASSLGYFTIDKIERVGNDLKLTYTLTNASAINAREGYTAGVSEHGIATPSTADGGMYGWTYGVRNTNFFLAENSTTGGCTRRTVTNGTYTFTVSKIWGLNGAIKNVSDSTSTQFDITENVTGWGGNCEGYTDSQGAYDNTGYTLAEIITGSIKFTNPVNGATIGNTNNFDYFDYTWNSIGEGLVRVYLSTSTDYSNFFASGFTTIPASSSASSTGIVFSPDYLTAGINTTTTIYSIIKLSPLFGNDIATDTIVYFVVNLQGTTTSTPPTASCNSGNYIYDPICRLGVYLFYPSQSVLSNYTSLKTSLENKPPFGYFTLTSGIINNLSTSTTSTFVLADLSLLNDTLITPLKTGISFLLWLLFLFWAFHRFRHIQL